eukprot:8345470-Lingulodinium_polyedra.AAC.1
MQEVRALDWSFQAPDLCRFWHGHPSRLPGARLPTVDTSFLGGLCLYVIACRLHDGSGEWRKAA